MGAVLLKSGAWVIAICIAAVVLIGIVVGVVLPTYERVSTSLAVPREWDPVMVGTWRAQLTDFDDKPKNEFRKYEFRDGGRLLVAYGPGRTQEMRWGTRAGKLIVRFFAVDAWVAVTYDYKVDASGNHLTIPRCQQRYGRILRDYSRVAASWSP